MPVSSSSEGAEIRVQQPTSQCFSDKDRAFVKGVVPHHGSALMMANMALMPSQNKDILKLSRDISRGQAQEIYDFQLWLLK